MLTVIQSLILCMAYSLVTYTNGYFEKKHIQCVIYDQICEPLHFCYILGATLNAFKVTPITSIIMASFVDYERSMYPHWLA